MSAVYLMNLHILIVFLICFFVTTTSASSHCDPEPNDHIKTCSNESEENLRAPLRVLSLNLHGYHPMGEAQRLLDKADGAPVETSSHLHFFRMSEIARGHTRQLDFLARTLHELTPDIVLLQEVGAGLPTGAKDCTEFSRRYPDDRLGKNSVLRLLDRLDHRGLGYSGHLACRGNIGWISNADTFRDARIVRRQSDSERRFEVVYDFGENPFPKGMIVEGTAILVRAPWKILDGKTWSLSLPAGQTFFFESIRIQNPQQNSPKWYLVVNIHAGHKVILFEQAVATRKALGEFIDQHPERASFGGVLVGGDLNGGLFRPSQKTGEVAMIPWEIKIPGEFDFGPTAPPQRFLRLARDLWALNLNPNYKPWATIGSGPEARGRVLSDVKEFDVFTKSQTAQVFALRETLFEAQTAKRCPIRLPSHYESVCETKDRIDHLMASPTFRVRRGAVIFSNNSYVSPKGSSDHPGILLELQAP